MDAPPNPPLTVGELCCVAAAAARELGRGLTTAELASLRTGSNTERIQVMLALLPFGSSSTPANVSIIDRINVMQEGSAGDAGAANNMSVGVVVRPEAQKQREIRGETKSGTYARVRTAHGGLWQGNLRVEGGGDCARVQLRT